MERIKLGKIINVRGLKGEIKVDSSTSFAKDRYKVGNKVILVNSNTKDELVVTVSRHSTVANFDFVLFEEITTVEQANKYRGYEVVINAENLPKLEDAYYFYELVNCRVIDENSSELGYISEVIDNPGNQIIRVKNTEKEFLVPFVKAFIKNVDIDNKVVTIHVMEGLF